MGKVPKKWELIPKTVISQEGITIEDALSIVQLSRIKKDKWVFGVLGMSSRSNSRNERTIVNSVGEGGIWVANSFGLKMEII